MCAKGVSDGGYLGGGVCDQGVGLFSVTRGCTPPCEQND